MARSGRAVREQAPTKRVADSRMAAGAWGPSKKQAEQLAALAALRELAIAVDTADGEVEIVWPKSVPG